MAAERKSIAKFSPEAKVGLFVVLGIVLLVYMSLRVGGIQFGGKEGYTLFVQFDSAAGLDKDASVRVAGVEVGRISEIELKNSRAFLTLRIKPGIRVGQDFTAVLTTKGLLGERYLELIPGSPNAPSLKEGEQILRTTSYADMDKLITILSDVSIDIKEVGRTLRNVLGGPEGETTLRNIIRNVEDISSRLNRLVVKNEQALDDIITNLGDFTALLKTEGPAISEQLRLAAVNLNRSLVTTSENLNRLIDENRGNISAGMENLMTASARLDETMEMINRMVSEVGPGVSRTVASVGSIADKIDRGQGTIGKLINEEETHTNLNKTIAGISNYIEKAESFQTYVGYRGEYLFDATETKSYLTLKIQPKADKYYLLEVIDDPRGKRTEETRVVTTGGVSTTTTETKTTDALKISLQIAKRYKNVTFRGGLIESTGGVAVDYNLFSDRFRFTLEAFDFDQAGNPHVKATGAIYFSRFFYLVGGYDDIFSRNGFDTGFVGMGLQFRDDDIKYLYGSAPPVSF